MRVRVRVRVRVGVRGGRDLERVVLNTLRIGELADAAADREGHEAGAARLLQHLVRVRVRVRVRLRLRLRLRARVRVGVGGQDGVRPLTLSMGRSVRGQSRKPVMLRKVTWYRGGGGGRGRGRVKVRVRGRVRDRAG